MVVNARISDLNSRALLPMLARFVLRHFGDMVVSEPVHPTKQQQTSLKGLFLICFIAIELAYRVGKLMRFEELPN